jgi:hypothetical protein
MNTTFVTSGNNENHFFSTLEEAQTDLETGIDFYKKEKITGTIYIYEIPSLEEAEDDVLTQQDKHNHFIKCLENETAIEIEKETV